MAAPRSGNAGTRQIAACYGENCAKRGRCVAYQRVERQGQERFVLTCRTPEGTHPLFEAIEPRRRTDESVVDSNGGEID